MSYFECIIGGAGTTLTVTCDSGFAGKTISCTDGITTLTATCPSASPYVVEFDIETAGTWTISGTISGVTHSTSVTIQTSADLHEIPTGSTATPVADIQTWLHCGNIWNKTYTTIAQVLADTSTLLALISSNNAVDYMARSTSWASSVCANSTAMTYIGNNNYCANKLLANSTWCTSICNSSYFESVLKKKVPSMTSATAPSGEVFATNYYTNNLYSPYKAFDGTGTKNGICGSSNGITMTIGYKFTSAVTIYKVVVNSFADNVTASMTLQYGDSTGGTFTSKGSAFNASGNQNTGIVTTQALSGAENKHTCWRLNVANAAISGYGYKIQFYGR